MTIEQQETDRSKVIDRLAGLHAIDVTLQTNP